MQSLSGFRRRFYRLARRYPRLARGGLTLDQMRELAERIGRQMGFEVDVAFRPWPWPATINRIGDTLSITVDDRQPPARQVGSLAHEVGHLALAHFAVDPFLADGGPDCEEEWEADLFALLVLDRTLSPLDHLGREQLDIFRDRANFFGTTC